MRLAVGKFKMRCPKPCLLWKWVFTLGILFWVPSFVLAKTPCQLYSGEKSLEALQQRITALLNGTIDHCEMANIYYQLARQPADLQSTDLRPADPQTRYLDLCIESAGRAIQQNSQAGAAYFFRGLCHGRKGESSGLWSSLKMIDPFRENMELAVKVAPGIDRGGPHRALGRLYYELPVLLGGSLKKSIQHLQQAIKYGPGYWENHFFLAESYHSRSLYAEAKDALATAMKTSAKDPDQSDAPERQQDFEDLMDSINEQCADTPCSRN